MTQKLTLQFKFCVTYLSLEMTIYKSNSNSGFSNTSTAHDDEVVGARSSGVIVFGATMAAKIVVLWILVSALGTLWHDEYELKKSTTKSERRNSVNYWPIKRKKVEKKI